MSISAGTKVICYTLKYQWEMSFYMKNQVIKTIRELDIVSLIIFRLIFESGHANAVAKKLGISASKVSRSLNTLRIAFDDDLFYRRKQGLKPTLLAEKLYPNICTFTHSVDQIERVIQNDEIPHADTILRIAVMPMIMRSIVIVLSDETIQEKIGKIQIFNWDDNSFENLHKGKLDIGLTYVPIIDVKDSYELTQEKINDTSSICIVAKEKHPIWEKSNEILLEDICKHQFLYMISQGFNDRIDPLEQFCRDNEIPLPKISSAHNYEEWYCHLLTMNSISFAPIGELYIANKLQGIRAEKLSKEQFNRLDQSLKTPRTFFTERTPPHRRYTDEMRDFLLSQIHKIYTDPKD